MPGSQAAPAASTCSALNREYVRFGCPFVAGNIGWTHPTCVDIRARERHARCPSPSGAPLRGLGAVSGSGLLFGLAATALGLVVIAKLAAGKEKGHLSAPVRRRKRK